MNKLKKITTEAKKLYKTGKYKKWTDAIKAASKKIGAIKIIEKGESKSAKPKATYQTVRTKKGTFKKIKKVAGVAKKKVAKKEVKRNSIHKDTRSHNVNIRVLSGTKRKTLGSLPPYKDPDAAREIQLYADNDSKLYYSRKLPIIKNLYRKWKKGNFDLTKAATLWKYYIEDAMQRYNKEFGSRGDKWHELLSTGDRKILSSQYAKMILDEFELGAYDDSILK